MCICHIPVCTWVEHVLGYTTSNYAGSKWQEHFIRLARSSPNAALMKRTFQSKGNKQCSECVTKRKPHQTIDKSNISLIQVEAVHGFSKFSFEFSAVTLQSDLPMEY